MATAGICVTLGMSMLGVLGCSANTSATSDTAPKEEAANVDKQGEEQSDYTIADLGVKYVVPKGYALSNYESNVDTSKGPVVAFKVTSEDGDSITMTAKAVSNLDVADNDFLDEQKDVALNAFEEKGIKVTDTAEGKMDMNEEVQLPVYIFTTTQGGKKVYVEEVFASSPNNDCLLTFTAASSDRANLDVMVQGITFL
jgi:hypothetical protein